MGGLTISEALESGESADAEDEEAMTAIAGGGTKG